MIIFDIEASGLHPESYPIEIAWQDSNDPESYDEFFIKPASGWTHWDDYAETEIHHISRKTIIESGISISEACSRLNTALEGKTIYSDAIDFDKRWMMRLFNQADLEPLFNFGSVLDLLPSTSDRIHFETLQNTPVKHRALEDARQIAKWMNLLLDSQ